MNNREKCTTPFQEFPKHVWFAGAPVSPYPKPHLFIPPEQKALNFPMLRKYEAASDLKTLVN